MQIQSAQLLQPTVAAGPSPVQAARPGGAEGQEGAAQEARESPGVQRLEGESVRSQAGRVLDVIA